MQHKAVSIRAPAFFAFGVPSMHGAIALPRSHRFMEMPWNHPAYSLLPSDRGRLLGASFRRYNAL